MGMRHTLKHTTSTRKVTKEEFKSMMAELRTIEQSTDGYTDKYDQASAVLERFIPFTSPLWRLSLPELQNVLRAPRKKRLVLAMRHAIHGRH